MAHKFRVAPAPLPRKGYGGGGDWGDEDEPGAWESNGWESNGWEATGRDRPGGKSQAGAGGSGGVGTVLSPLAFVDVGRFLEWFLGILPPWRGLGGEPEAKEAEVKGGGG